MGYLALTCFISDDAIAERDESIPDEQKTPEYWAQRLSHEWMLLSQRDLERKLRRFFEEFDRLSKAETARQANGDETARQGP